ncbi:MAG: hypothetical protein AB1568_11925 [Thermodesulfobacteriota bacterium]
MRDDEKILALRPYLERVESLCRPLDREALQRLFLSLAREVPAGGRAAFLHDLTGLLAGRTTGEPAPVRDTIKRIEVLERQMARRAEAMEDGSYWGEYDDGEYYHDDPPILTAEMEAEVADCLEETGQLFRQGLLAEARQVYSRLFAAVRIAEEHGHDWSRNKAGLREGRARHCRAVYELTAGKKRLSAMLAAMEIEADGGPFGDEVPGDVPLLQDVIDAQTGDLPGLAEFLLQWDKALSGGKIANTRLAALRLEAAFMLGGVAGVAALARQWRAEQPLGYVTWCDRLRSDSDWKGMAAAAREGLAELPPGYPRAAAAARLIEAGQALGDRPTVLEGRRERFRSLPAATTLLSLLAAAGRGPARQQELSLALDVMKKLTRTPMFDSCLYAKTLLMAGRLPEAFALAEKAKPVGWSYGSPAGVVFAAVLHLAAGGRESGAVSALLHAYGDAHGYDLDQEPCASDAVCASIPEEIVHGLALAGPDETALARYLEWARTIGEKRVNHIVANKHRGAYDRAAQVLAALAETRCVRSGKAEAQRLLDDYYRNRYNRFSAFRACLRSAVGQSPLLRGVKL